MAFFKDLGSSRSPTTRSAFRSAMFSVRLVGRTSTRRSAPCAPRSCATWLPTNPVAPVTRTFIRSQNAECGQGHCPHSSKTLPLLQCFRFQCNIFFSGHLLLPILANPGLKALSGGGIAPRERQRGDV